ncbi:unnamed protein product, partial [Polarella glacialis]
MGDADTALAAVLAPGVSTGVFEPVSASGVWLCRLQPDLQEHLPLLCCSSNWLSAEHAPEVVTTLVQQDLRDQFVKRFDGSLEEARMKWPLGIAVGKLGVTTVEGRDPRLTLGSTEPHVNPNVRINEKTFNPGHRDESFVGFTMDVSKAHKRIKVRHEDQGLLMFPPLHASLLVALMCVLKVPMSWHKCHLKAQIDWIGLSFNFNYFFVQLPYAKIRKGTLFLDKVAATTRLTRVDLEKGIGLLLWISDVFLFLRPWLSSFYRALFHPPATLLSASRTQLQEILDCCDECLRVVRAPTLCNVSLGWKLLQVGRTLVNNKSQVLSLHSGSSRMCLRMHNPCSRIVQIDPGLQRLAASWSNTVRYSPMWRSMLPARFEEGSAAADAFATGSTVGIGGWLRSSASTE